MRQELYQQIADFFIHHQSGLYRLAYSYTGNQEDAMDAVQSAVYKALVHHESLRDENAVKTWCYRIVINESVALLRKRRRESPVSGDWSAEEPYIEKGYERDDDLFDRVNRLPERIQEVIKLRFYEDLSLQEIAGITGTNLNTVKTRLYRGLRMLKKEMEEARA